MKNIKIGYRDYKIKNLDSIVSKCNEINGQFLASDGMIALSSTEDNISHANTLIHEIVHLLLDHFNAGLKDKDEEKVCEVLGSGLSDLFAQNPRLLKYINSVYSNNKK